MEQVIDNYINGNLQDAKNGAKRFGWRRLFLYLRGTGFSESEATHVANFLKGLGTFQAACDAQGKS